MVMERLYVYEDWTIEEVPRCFYVGQGYRRRVDKTQRNQFHTNIVNKHGLKRRVVFESIHRSEVDECEMRLIAEHHTYVGDPQYNGIGCNMTRGGEHGTLGYKFNDEQRARRRIMHQEIQNRPEVRERRRETTRKIHATPELKARLVEGMKAAQNRPEVRVKNSLNRKRQWALWHRKNGRAPLPGDEQYY
jgi:hypothetical protein